MREIGHERTGRNVLAGPAAREVVERNERSERIVLPGRDTERVPAPAENPPASPPGAAEPGGDPARVDRREGPPPTAGAPALPRLSA